MQELPNLEKSQVVLLLSWGKGANVILGRLLSSGLAKYDYNKYTVSKSKLYN